ncbi:MAG: sodium:solute symporter family protein [Acidobacteria bacterium]|nr:sodium:solute symporter family protein [Acidobacteriota bacterium]
MAIAAVFIMYALFLAVGWFAARKVKDGSATDMIVAGRAMPLWIATLTMTATWVDGGYLLGTAEGTYKSSVALGMQGGLCFGVSLILGGLFFAKRMRQFEFTTLIDPFEARFGKYWAAVLFLPAMLGEVFWSAELLVAIGSTLAVMIGMKLSVAILLSAIVIIAYTMLGGMWSVAYTDAIQLGLVAIGLLVALPFVFEATGGLGNILHDYHAARPDRFGVFPPWQSNHGFWTTQSIINWWDVSAMLVFGGIPWNCYFQRVLSCQTPKRAQQHSILAGLLTIAFTIPPLLLGLAAFRFAWAPNLLAELQAQPSQTLPMIFQYVTPPLVGILGLGAIIGAVTSSFSSSILSAGSMFTWNFCHRLIRPDLSLLHMKRLLRMAIVMLGVAATVMAFKVQSVQALWFFTSDLIFVLLFPQLVFALFDPKVNRIGSVVAFCVSLLLRLGGGEPLFDLPPLIPYPELVSFLLPGDPQAWYDGTTLLFPYKTVAMLMGFVLLPIVSRLTAKWSPALPLKNVTQA